MSSEQMQDIAHQKLEGSIGIHKDEIIDYGQWMIKLMSGLKL
jgi:hypothetical protein